MRNRNIQLNIRLTEDEMEDLKRYSKSCKLTTSGYIRMLINGYVPKETPPKEYDQLLRIMTEIHRELTRHNDNSAAIMLRKALLMLQAEVTLPERRT
ncbi:hypothetical protein SDC9_121889 [bioreactor metagenome]|uniref:Uncharacterized protein n=1 Tax=bioreactor metagenome TaxID=1076179 RepID=A0A645CDA3_9ZZZZ